jgi:glucosamine--fructose-6-phosphate aminotransferase (isomerizing)
MCGIVGGVTPNKDIVPFVLQGLQSVEYRGYDSAGLVLIEEGTLVRERVTGVVKELKLLCESKKTHGDLAIGHTRWATHGAVTLDNTHPHISHDTWPVMGTRVIDGRQPFPPESDPGDQEW